VFFEQLKPEQAQIVFRELVTEIHGPPWFDPERPYLRAWLGDHLAAYQSGYWFAGPFMHKVFAQEMEWLQLRMNLADCYQYGHRIILPDGCSCWYEQNGITNKAREKAEKEKLDWAKPEYKDAKHLTLPANKKADNRRPSRVTRIWRDDQQWCYDIDPTVDTTFSINDWFRNEPATDKPIRDSEGLNSAIHAVAGNLRAKRELENKHGQPWERYDDSKDYAAMLERAQSGNVVKLKAGMVPPKEKHRDKPPAKYQPRIPRQPKPKNSQPRKPN